MRARLNTLNDKDLAILGGFLIWLEKVGNPEAHICSLQVCAEEYSRDIRRRLKDSASDLMKEVERSMFIDSQSKDGSEGSSIQGLARALSYTTKKKCK